MYFKLVSDEWRSLILLLNVEHPAMVYRHLPLWLDLPCAHRRVLRFDLNPIRISSTYTLDSNDIVSLIVTIIVINWSESFHTSSPSTYFSNARTARLGDGNVVDELHKQSVHQNTTYRGGQVACNGRCLQSTNAKRQETALLSCPTSVLDSLTCNRTLRLRRLSRLQ